MKIIKRPLQNTRKIFPRGELLEILGSLFWLMAGVGVIIYLFTSCAISRPYIRPTLYTEMSGKFCNKDGVCLDDIKRGHLVCLYNDDLALLLNYINSVERMCKDN
jgi:hypothetical protein